MGHALYTPDGTALRRLALPASAESPQAQIERMLQRGRLPALAQAVAWVAIGDGDAAATAGLGRITVNWATGAVTVAADETPADAPEAQLAMRGQARLRRRPMIQRNRCAQTAFPENLSAGHVVVQTASADTYGPRRVSFQAQAGSATARTYCTRALSGLDTNAFYALVVEIDAVTRQSGSTWQTGWFGLSVAPAASSVTHSSAGFLNGTTHAPRVGRMGFVFKPSAATMTLWFGMGAAASAVTTTGDALSIASIGLYQVNGLTDPLPPFAFSPRGPVGYDAAPQDRPIGSCVLCVGDSWSVKATDYPAVLSEKYQREVLIVASGGHRLWQMLNQLRAASGDFGRLYPPNKNIPGVIVLMGGINDRVQDDQTAPRIIAGAQAIVEEAARMNMPIIIGIESDCTNSAHYTAARAAVWERWANWVIGSGLPYFDTRTVLHNADGTANATNMLEEEGGWSHPTPAGSEAMAALAEAEIRKLDAAGFVGGGIWAAA